MDDLAAAVDPEFDDFDRRNEIVLNGHYRIFPSAPLPALDTPTARAFRVEKMGSRSGGHAADSGFFARINDSGLPSRAWEIDAIRELRHPHLMHLFDIGATRFSGSGAAALTAVFKYPKGGRLMAPEGAAPMPLREVSRMVIAPLCGALNLLHGHNVIHRAIHPDNLFLERKSGTEVILGECITSPAGHNLPNAFQPLERASAPPLASGVGDKAADIYSFGVTIAALLAGQIPGAGLSHEALLHARMTQGSLAALCGAFHFPREIEHFLGGLLADDPDHRWALADLKEWLTGKKVAVAANRIRDKPKRTFPFAEQEFQNPVAIAEAFNHNLSDAVTEIESGRLEKWLASDHDRLAVAETVIGLHERNAVGSGNLTSEALVSRVCMALDPKGPIRYEGMTVSIDAVGTLLADAFIEGRQDIADTIIAMLDQGLPVSWIAAVGKRRRVMAGESSNFIRLRQYVKNPNLGYGLERCLYELNPSLCCLHPLVDVADCDDAGKMLTSLNEHCSAGAGEPVWTDRHVVAYLAAHMHPRSDGCLASISLPGRSRAIKTMTGLALVALAQETLDVPTLPRLTGSSESALLEIAEIYYSESRRKTLQSTLKRELKRGDFTILMELLNDTGLQDQDRREYYDAQARYQRLDAEIAGLKDDLKGQRVKAALVGRRTAAWAAFLGLLAVSFMTMAGGLAI